MVYSSRNFDSALAEAAHAIAGHGFAEAEFGSVQEGGWNALVVVSPTILLNLGENEVRDTLLDFMPNMPVAGYLVWIREDSRGFVTEVEYASDEGLRSGTDLLNRAFDKASEYGEDE